MTDMETTAVTARAVHSEIEKRRRDKINQYIDDLCTMIPMPLSVKAKPDKLTVLRLTVQHIKAVRGISEPMEETGNKPSFMTDSDLHNLITQSSGGFLFVVECDPGRILCVTDSVQAILNMKPTDLINNNFYDFVHPGDMAMIKKQLSTISSNDVKMQTDNNGTKTDKLCPGARRSFLCRMKKGAIFEKAGHHVDNNYVDVSFDGYLRSWPPTPQQKPSDCRLVVIVRPLKLHDLNTDYMQLGQIREFETRHKADGVFTYVDRRFTTVLGFHQDDIAGKSIYSYCHNEDLQSLASWHQRILHKTVQRREEVMHRLRAKGGHHVPLKTTGIVFRNPWSKEVDFVVLKHVIMVPISSSIALICEERRLEKETRVELEGSFNQQSELTEDMKDLLRRMANLDRNEGNSRKRGSNMGGATAATGPEHLGTMIAEQAKILGQASQGDVQTVTYSNESYNRGTVGGPAVQPAGQNDLASWQTMPAGAVDPHVGIALKPGEVGYAHAPADLAQNIMMKQLEGILGAIDAMEREKQDGDEDEEKFDDIINELADDDGLENVLNGIAGAFGQQ